MPSTATQAPPTRSTAALDAGDFENHCPICGGALAWGAVDRGRPARRRAASYAASKVAQEHYAAAWARQAGGAAIALRYHNVYGPGMPRDTPYSGVAAIFRSSLEHGEAPQVFEDGGQMRDFVHVADVARANLLALRAVADAPGESYAAYNVAPARRSRSAMSRSWSAAARPPPIAPAVTGRYRLGDVRHVVASPGLARAELGFAAEIGPAQGLPEFATAPLRD